MMYWDPYFQSIIGILFGARITGLIVQWLVTPGLTCQWFSLVLGHVWIFWMGKANDFVGFYMRFCFCSLRIVSSLICFAGSPFLLARQRDSGVAPNRTECRWWCHDSAGLEAVSCWCLTQRRLWWKCCQCRVEVTGYAYLPKKSASHGASMVLYTNLI